MTTAATDSAAPPAEDDLFGDAGAAPNPFNEVAVGASDQEGERYGAAAPAGSDGFGDELAESLAEPSTEEEPERESVAEEDPVPNRYASPPSSQPIDPLSEFFGRDASPPVEAASPAEATPPDSPPSEDGRAVAQQPRAGTTPFPWEDEEPPATVETPAVGPSPTDSPPAAPLDDPFPADPPATTGTPPGETAAAPDLPAPADGTPDLDTNSLDELFGSAGDPAPPSASSPAAPAASGPRGTPGASGEGPSDIRHRAWLLGSKLSLAALAQEQGTPSGEVQRWFAQSRGLAASLGESLPDLPASQAPADRLPRAALDYLFAQGHQIGRGLAARHGADTAALFELAIKSNMLLALYEPGSPAADAIAEAISRAGPRAELPPSVWQPLLRVLSTSPPLAEVRAAVHDLHRAVDAHLAVPRRATPEAAVPFPTPRELPNR